MLEVRGALGVLRHSTARSTASISASARGEIVVMLGANGAGKITLLKAIAGLVAPQAGSARALDGRDLAGAAAARRSSRPGIALVPEGAASSAELTVRENLALGAHAQTRARQARRTISRACWTLFPRLAERSAAAGAHHERRRAADGRDRPRADVGADDPAARRAFARPVAAAVRRAVPHARADPRHGRRHPAGRAERHAEPRTSPTAAT